MKKLKIIAAVMCTWATFPANAATGTDLAGWCEHYNASGQQSSPDGAACVGHIIEAHEAFLALDAYKINHVCIPENWDTTQIVLIVKEFMSKHPEELQCKGAYNVFDALAEVFPYKE